MEARGLNQEELAGLLNTTPATVSRWVNGKSMPDGAAASYLALRLGVPLPWLTRGVDDITSRNPLRTAREQAGMSIKQLAAMTGYAIGVLQAVEAGARASEKMIEKICQALPNVSKEDLMGGSETPPILHEAGSEGTYGAKPSLRVDPKTKVRYVPLLSWAQAGHYDLAHSDEAYDYTGVVAFDVKDSRAFALEIEGDSMSPELQPGDRVIVAPSWTPRAGDTVIARTVDGDVYCKLYERQAGGKFRLISINQKYPAIELDADEVAWMYPVAQITKTVRRS